MPTRLPFDQLLVPVRQIGARITVSLLARYSSALVFLPLAPSEADWRALPHGAVLRGLYARKVRKAGDCFHLRVGAHAQTLLIVACLADEASTFERRLLSHKCTRPRVLLRWQARYSAVALTANVISVIKLPLSSGFGFSRSS